jgi:nucleoside-diphosphate-sugar epimerase
VEPVINIGSGKPCATRDLVRAIAERVGFAGEIQEAAGKGSPRSAYVDWQVADVSMAERVLGWRARYDLADTVAFMTQATAAKS